ncbi:MAG: agmatine deiminase family protein [Saprospiraceae bacterium]|nr:agmatine deiminase family protein [Saprospiraceae bacterium]
MLNFLKIYTGNSIFKTPIVLSLFIGFSCSTRLGVNENPPDNHFYTQGLDNRLAAEWEPAIGTMLVWPLSVPYKLVIELARDNHVYTIVENEAVKKEAQKWYNDWGINPAKTSFIYAAQGLDSWWVRDWGPGAVYTPEGKMKLADGKYIFSTPITGLPCQDSLEFIYKTKEHKIIKTEIDDAATLSLGNGLNLAVLDLPFINTGGNVANDGLGTAFSTCILLNENQYFGISENRFFKLNKELTGIRQYHILSNFEKRGIQHIDCYLKLLDEERMLVIEPPLDHDLYPIYESILQKELVGMKTPYGRPYEIVRIKTGRYYKDQLAAYTNSLILNKTIYVPLFKIKEDEQALKRWQEVMPGYTVKGFEFELKDEPMVSQKLNEHYLLYGWRDGDALHCRTRAIWDPEMLFISAKRIESPVNSTHKNIVYCTIIDYSKKGLIQKQCLVHWRISGRNEWNSIRLKPNGTPNLFYAEIPFHQAGTSIEYYISAVSSSGKTETKPRTAPQGTYTFSIQ